LRDSREIVLVRRFSIPAITPSASKAPDPHDCPYSA
jgi:hypothetical protein